MPSAAPVALAIGVGYVLGRNHKLKWAVLLGTAAATGQMRGLSTQALERGTKMLRANPEFSKLADTATGLLQAGRSAAVSAMQSRTEALTGTLGDKAGQLGEAGEKATGKLTERAKSRKGGDEKARDEDAEARDEDAEDEYDEDDEYEDEADDQNAEDEEDSGDEVEDEEEDEEEDEDEEEEEEEQKEPEPAAKGGRQDGLRRSLNDLDRLSAIARSHHLVVEAAATRQPTAPARLATVYEDDDGVREMLAGHRDALIGALDHVTGRQEWGVKAYVAARSGPVDEPAGPAPTTGTAYLSQRRSALQAREASHRQVTTGAGALAERLAPLAVDVHRHRPQDPQLSGDNRAMVLNDAYLVDLDDAEAFARTVQRLADAHAELSIELTGPWPPYSFAVIEEVTP